MVCGNTALANITTTSFKEQFYNQFTFIDTYSSTTTYAVGDIVYYNDSTYNDSNYYYTCLADNTTGQVPTNTTYWSVTSNTSLYVNDDDITNAYAQACLSFNSTLFSNASTTTGNFTNTELGYLFLAAHYLVHDFRSNGIKSIGLNQVVDQKADTLNMKYLPQKIANNPVYAFYCTTSYGQKYLNMIMPLLVGNVQVCWGWTTP